jgi:hypothetical protein
MPSVIVRHVQQKFGIGQAKKHPDFERRLQYLWENPYLTEDMFLPEIYFYCQNGYFINHHKFIIIRAIYLFYRRFFEPRGFTNKGPLPTGIIPLPDGSYTMLFGWPYYLKIASSVNTNTNSEITKVT